jgi:hypothetical protein
MTLIDERPPDELDARTEATSGPQLPAAGDEEVLAPPALRDLLRPALAGGLSSAAAGITLGGVFGSWSARGLGIAAAALGAATVVVALRSTRTSQIQWAYPLLLIAVSVASVAPSPKYGAGGLLRAMRDAIDAGRVLRPPVPFDPGWRPIVIIIIGLLSFGAAWVGAALDRPRLAVALPLPIVALTAITQPEDGQVLTGVSAFVLVLAALAVLFRGDSTVTEELSGQFELKRALRSAAATVPILVLLVALSQTSFLFPKPTYNPGNTAQKPRVVPLSASHDRVLFEVKTKASFTGPWRTGVLDVYSDGSWKLPPLRIDRLRQLASDGSLGTPRGDAAKNLVTVTVRDLGNSAVLPLLGGTARVDLPAGSPFRLDKRTELLRLPSGRPQPGLSYTMHVPDYPSNADLARATPGGGKDLADQLAVPSPPPFVQKLLAQAPPQPWKRLDFLRTRLYDVVTAQGGGVPVDVPPSKVDDLLDGSKKGSPYEIVAAEALLARWSRLPSRIAYGFDGLNREKTLRTVRPRNSAQWLEVNFDGYGWVRSSGRPSSRRQPSTRTRTTGSSPRCRPVTTSPWKCSSPTRSRASASSTSRSATSCCRSAPSSGSSSSGDFYGQPP